MPDEFTPEEKAYVDSRGEQGPQVEEATQEPVPVEKPAEAAVEKPAEQPQAEERVPVAAIQEERRRRKEAEKQAQELRAQYERLHGRLDVLGQQIQPQQQEDPAQEDPLARLERLEQEHTQRRQVEQLQMRHQSLGQQFDAAASEFAKAEPAFGDAIKHLVDSRKQELLALPGIDPGQVNALVGQDMVNFLNNCAAQGVNPAERAWQWAQARGFRKGEGAASPQNPSQAAQADIARIAAGQQAARSLGQASGAPGGEITLESIADMPMNEFGKWLSGNQGKLRQMFGG